MKQRVLTPSQLLQLVQRGELSPAYLFIGPEQYYRRLCKQALTKVLQRPKEQPGEAAWEIFDLNEVSLEEALQGALSYSLFSVERMVWIDNVETIATKRGAKKASEVAQALLAGYLKSPAPGTVLVFNSSCEIEQKEGTRYRRVREFFSDVPVVVEFQPLSQEEALALASSLARQAGLKIAPDALHLMVDVLEGDGLRIASEIEKLRLYSPAGHTVTTDLIWLLIPDARMRSVWALVEALVRRDMRTALDTLQLLVRQGEYLPLALASLATQFRLALVAAEKGLQSPAQIQRYFSSQRLPMWPSRAREIYTLVRGFSPAQMRRALELIFQTDRWLRSANPDDRLVLENFVVGLLQDNPGKTPLRASSLRANT